MEFETASGKQSALEVNKTIAVLIALLELKVLTLLVGRPHRLQLVIVKLF